MPSVRLSAVITSQRQNRRIPRSRVPTVEGSQISAIQALVACQVSSSSVAGRPRLPSRRLKQRTDWLYGSVMRFALAAARKFRGKDASRSASRIATAAGFRVHTAVHHCGDTGIRRSRWSNA